VNEKRVPAIFADSELVDAGALMALGANRFDDVRRAADMLARVLRGAKPSELPVDQASRFELAVNLKTARAIGIRVPQSIVLRANRVIE
jgi:putative ABC transport system substrate-binding protein